MGKEEGKGQLSVCQYRLSSERGRELWRDVMDRRRGEGRQGERKTEMSEVKKTLRGDIKLLAQRPLALEPSGSQSVRHMPIPGKC